jgi:cardiolipin synthase A/B
VLHEKIVVYDESITLLGSSNIDQRSFRLNYELSVLILSTSFSNVIARYHDADLKESERYTLEKWLSRSIFQRLGDWFFSLFRSQL